MKIKQVKEEKSRMTKLKWEGRAKNFTNKCYNYFSCIYSIDRVITNIRKSYQ